MKLVFLTSTLASASLIDRIADKHGNEFASSLANHGCHCKKLSSVFDKDNVGGTPVDDLDALCRDFFSAKSCMHLIDGSCQNLDTSSFDDKASGCGSSAPGSCGEQLCLNNEEFLDNLGNYIGMAVSAGAQCSSTQTAPKSHCCGSFPSMIKYSEDQGTCENGQFTLASLPTFSWPPGPPQCSAFTGNFQTPSLKIMKATGDNISGFKNCFDEDYSYILHESYTDLPEIRAMSKSDGSVVKTYSHPDLTGEYNGCEVVGNFLVVVGSKNNEHVVVYDKTTTEVVDMVAHEDAKSIAIDGDVVLVAAQISGKDQVWYRISGEGKLTPLDIEQGLENCRGVGFDESYYYMGGTYNGNYEIWAYDKASLGGLFFVAKKMTSDMTGSNMYFFDQIWSHQHPTLGNVVIDHAIDKTIYAFDVATQTQLKKLSFTGVSALVAHGHMFTRALYTDVVEVRDVNAWLDGDDAPLFTFKFHSNLKSKSYIYMNWDCFTNQMIAIPSWGTDNFFVYGF